MAGPVRLASGGRQRPVRKIRDVEFLPFPRGGKNRIALPLAFTHNPSMLARVLSAAVNGIEAFPVEVEVNCGW